MKKKAFYNGFNAEMKIPTNYCFNQRTNTNKIRSTKNFQGVNLKFRKDIPSLKPCDKLIVLAHPDDEVCFFGFINKFIKNAKEKVQLVYLTSGQKGRDERGIIPRYDARMRDQRLKELEDSMNVTDVTREDPLILDMMDGETHFKENRPIALKSLLEILHQTMPNEVYSFDGSGITGHTDHITASRTTSKAVDMFKNVKQITQYQVGYTQDTTDEIIDMTKNSSQIFLYSRPSIEEPDRTIDIREEIPEIIEAFSKYESQFTNKACKDLNLYFTKNPYIDLKQVNCEKEIKNEDCIHQ